MTDDDTEHPEPTPVASYATLGEAEVAQAKLRAYGVEAFLDDQVEGGSVPIEGEPGVIVTVRGQDATSATSILGDGDAAESTSLSEGGVADPRCMVEDARGFPDS